MRIEKFEDIEAWKEARELVKLVYDHFKDIKDYSFKDQIQRSAISIMSNIAEGFDRSSNKEFIQFLVIARASASEVRSLIYVASDNGYIDKRSFEILTQMCLKINNLINGFIRYLKNSKRTH